MNEDDDTTIPSEAPQPETAGERTFTQSEVNALLAKNKASVQRKVSAELDRKMAEMESRLRGLDSPAPSAPSPAPSSRSTQDELRFYRALDKEAAARGVPLSESAERRIAAAWNEEKPKDIGPWIASYFEDFGLTPKQNQQTPEPTNRARSENQSREPISNVVAPTSARSLETVRVGEMMQDEILNKFDLSSHASRRALIEQVTREMRGTAIRPEVSRSRERK